MKINKALCRGAFTLVELLVVVTIVAILAALILPSLSNAKAQARSVKCKSNLRQVGMALALYVGDNASTYPLYATGTVGPNGLGLNVDSYWATDLNSYLKQPSLKIGTPPLAGVWACPSIKGPRALGFGLVPTIPNSASYGYNSDGLRGILDSPLLGLGGHKNTFDPATRNPVRESEIVSPANLLALGDGIDGRDMWGSEESDLLRRTIIPSVLASQGGNSAPDSNYVLARHSRKVNVVFCDSHAQAFRFEALFKDRSDESLRLWNRDNQPHRDLLLGL